MARWMRSMQNPMNPCRSSFLSFLSFLSRFTVLPEPSMTIVPPSLFYLWVLLASSHLCCCIRLRNTYLLRRKTSVRDLDVRDGYKSRKRGLMWPHTNRTASIERGGESLVYYKLKKYIQKRNKSPLVRSSFSQIDLLWACVAFQKPNTLYGS